jgi:hypothetical protein
VDGREIEFRVSAGYRLEQVSRQQKVYLRSALRGARNGF